MTPDEAQSVMDYLKQSNEMFRTNLRLAMESQLDHGDRAIAQVAQLKILNESSQTPVEIIQALQEVAAGGNPL